jgi:hypothetical protein
VFKDFAVYGNNSQGVRVDPATGPYTRAGVSASSGGVGNAWVRQHITFVPDRDSTYLAPAFRVLSPNQSVTNSEHLNAQYFAKFQLERSKLVSNGAPSAFSNAREVQVVVKPDRLNLVVNPRLATNTTSWAADTNCTIAQTTVSGVTGMQMTATATAGSMSATLASANRFPVTAGVTYTGQASWVPVSAVTRQVRVQFAWYDSAGALLSSSLGTYATETTGQRVRTTVTATAPTSAATAAIQPYVASPAAAEVHHVSYFVVEKGTTAGTYFDGASGDDYLWETGGTAHAARSYYYENFLDRSEAVSRALLDAVPLGIGVGVAKYGVLTD